MSQPDSVQKKYDILNAKYKELFKRTAELSNLDKKIKQSKKDLETTIKFLRAELNTKSAFQGVKNTSNFEFIGMPSFPKGEKQEPEEQTGNSEQAERTAGTLFQKVSQLYFNLSFFVYIAEHAASRYRDIGQLDP